jgi:DNA-binding transcriptional ArsR family regulator
MLRNFFISEVRVKTLKLLLLNPKETYHVRAIVRAINAEINAVRRELDNLLNAGFVSKRKSSNKLFYTVNTEHVFYPELLGLVAKEEGLGAAVIKGADSLGRIEFAILSKEFVKGRDPSVLAVDLFVVGEVFVDALSKIVKEYELKKGVEINFSTMASAEFQHRKRTLDQFVMRILSQSRIMLLGDEEKFCALS